MKEDDRENRPALRYFRYAVMSFTALIVLSLGFTLVPADPPAPADPPFSEQARRSALQDSLDLRAAAERLLATTAAPAVDNPAATDNAVALHATVTLLTLQARALLSPADSSPVEDPARGAVASATPPPPRTPGPSAGASTTAETTLPELASALSDSGVQRIIDAAKADGGMARLLAGAGIAQQLAAENLASAAGVEAATLPHAGAAAPPAAGSSAPAPDPTTAACPSPFPAPGVAGPGVAGAGVSGAAAPRARVPGQEPPSAGTAALLGGALSAAAAAGQQGVYAYQAALPRLGPAEAPTAETFLGQHRKLAAEAAAHSRAACNDTQEQQPGFVLDPDFLAAPGDGLARLELAALPAYGDVIAQSDGGLRSWAIAALESAARRAAHWSGEVGPVPGLLLDQDQLPELPASPTPRPTGT